MARRETWRSVRHVVCGPSLRLELRYNTDGCLKGIREFVDNLLDHGISISA